MVRDNFSATVRREMSDIFRQLVQGVEMPHEDYQGGI